MGDALVELCESGAQQPYLLCADDRLRAVDDFQLAVDSEGVGFHHRAGRRPDLDCVHPAGG
jgi:hypothetical protein